MPGRCAGGFLGGWGGRFHCGGDRRFADAQLVAAVASTVADFVVRGREPQAAGRLDFTETFGSVAGLRRSSFVVFEAELHGGFVAVVSCRDGDHADVRARAGGQEAAFARCGRGLRDGVLGGRWLGHRPTVAIAVAACEPGSRWTA